MSAPDPKPEFPRVEERDGTTIIYLEPREPFYATIDQFEDDHSWDEWRRDRLRYEDQ